MYKVKYDFFICIVIVILSTQAFENNDKSEEYHDPNNMNEERSEEAYTELPLEFDEDLWHVDKFKDSDFETTARRSECKPETLEDKIKRYRKALIEDAARVKFVSAFSLPLEKKPIDECNIPPKIPTSSEDIHINSTLAKSNSTIKKSSRKSRLLRKARKFYPNETIVGDVVSPATKAPIQSLKNADEKTGQRRSDYVGGSVEYYDTTVEWNDDWCPEFVSSYSLEMDIFRKVDVECELILMWRSLD